jgi:hypothetical protein
MGEELKAGDKVRYCRDFLKAHKNRQMAEYFAALEGTVMDIFIQEGLEVAQIDFGSQFRATSIVAVAKLEKF